MNDNYLDSKYDVKNLGTEYKDTPIYIRELIDLYYAMGPNRDIRKFYDFYLGRCEAHDVESQFTLEDMISMYNQYKWDRECNDRLQSIKARTDSVVVRETVRETLPESIVLKRKQIARLSKMEQLAEAIFEKVIDRIPSLESADLKTVVEYIRIAQKLIEYTHGEENSMMEREVGANSLTKDEILQLVPESMQEYMENAAKRLLGES